VKVASVKMKFPIPHFCAGVALTFLGFPEFPLVQPIRPGVWEKNCMNYKVFAVPS